MSENLDRAMENNHWNTTTLHEHLTMMITDLSVRMEERFTAQETAVKAAMEAAEKAVLKAEALATTRSEQQNEWRDTIGDLIHTMMPRNEYETIHANLVDKIDEGRDRNREDLESLRTALTGEISDRKGGANVMVAKSEGVIDATKAKIAGLGALLAFIITLLGYLIFHAISH